MTHYREMTPDERQEEYRKIKYPPTTDDLAFQLPRVQWIRKADKQESFDRVLDIGCQDGFATRWLLWRDDLEVLVGIDLSEDAIQTALRLSQGKLYGNKARYLAIPFQQFQAASLFTEVVCFELLEHLTIEEARELLTVIDQYCERGARVFMTTPHKEGPFGNSNPDPQHITLYNCSEVAALLQQLCPGITEIQITKSNDGLIQASWRKL